MTPVFDLSLPDSRMAAAFILSRDLRARFQSVAGEIVDWDAIRRRGVLPAELFLPAIEFFRSGCGEDLYTIYECGRILVAPRNDIGLIRSVLALLPGRDDVTEARLDGDWVVCRLRHVLDEQEGRTRAEAGFFRRHRRRFPREVRLDGVDYHCSYGFANWGDFIGIDPIEIALGDLRSWFDSFGHVFLPLYHPKEKELQEALLVSPLGMREEDDPWCWSLLADRLIPFLLADNSPMRRHFGGLVAEVETLIGRFRRMPWSLPVDTRSFRRMQSKLHWTFDGEFDEVPTLLAVVSGCERQMAEFAAGFEPLIAGHAGAMLDIMDTYCRGARERLLRRLEDDACP